MRPPGEPPRVAVAASFFASCLVLALAFTSLFGSDQLPSRRDLLLFFLPFKSLLAESYRGGELPLWNPWTFLGTPFLATLHSGVFYPPSALLLIPSALGFNAFILFHYFVGLTGAWALLRNCKLGLVAVSLGSLTYVIGGYLVSLLNVTNHLQSAVWAPLALCLWSRHLQERSRFSATALTAVIALQILGGSPETVLMTLAVLLGWGIYRALPEMRRALRESLILGGMTTLALGLTAFQTLPTAELTAHSVRGSAFGFEQVTLWSLEPVSLLQLLFPHSSSLLGSGEQNTVGPMLESQVPWLSSLYVGLVPLCLVIVGMTRGGDRAFWATVAAVGVLFALGKHGPLLPALYDLAPTVFGKFRFPEKFWFLVHFAAVVLAAQGAERVMRGEREARRLFFVAASSFLAIALVILGIRWTRPVTLLQVLAFLRGTDAPLIQFAALGTDFVFKAQRLILILGAAAVILFLERTRLIRRPLAGALLVALTAADLGGAHHNLNLSISWSRLMSRAPLVDVDGLRKRHLRVFNYQTVSSRRWGSEAREIAGLEEGLKVLRSTDDVRAFAYAEWPALPGNAGILYGLGTVFGSEAIDREEIETLRDVLAVVPRERAVHILRLYSTGALIGSAPLDVPSLRRVEADASHFAYEVRNPVPRAYLVWRLTPAGDRLAAFNALIARDFEAGRQAVVDQLPENWRDRPADDSPDEVVIEHYGKDNVSLRTHASEAAFLVLNDSWFPGWEADVDGTPADIVRTNVLVRGVVVPAGEHQVRFRYRPLSFRVGAGISVITAMISLAWLALRARRPAGLRAR